MAKVLRILRVVLGDLCKGLWYLPVNLVAGSPLMPRYGRCLIYRLCGLSVRSWNIWPGCVFKNPKVTIDSRTFVNEGCRFDSHAPITIGDNCAVAMEVLFCTSTHQVGSSHRRGSEKTMGLPVRVGNGVWVGARAIILPGVTIGDGCVIAAGAVVTRDCEPNGVYAGVPARRIKDLPLDAAAM